MKFESYLEEIMYKPLLILAKKYGYKLIYQYSFPTTEHYELDWFQEKIAEGVDEDELQRWADEHGVPTSYDYDYDYYRIDYVLENQKRKIAIELDGKEWHNEKTVASDEGKNRFLKNEGFIVLRFTSDKILGEIAREKTILEISKLIESFPEISIPKNWGRFL